MLCVSLCLAVSHISALLHFSSLLAHILLSFSLLRWVIHCNTASWAVGMGRRYIPAIRHLPVTVTNV